jgi:ribosome-associated translation inhibitor RaiA
MDHPSLALRMFLPLQITLRNVPRSPELDELIRARAQWLENFHPRLSSCRVTVEASGHQDGRQFVVRIVLKVPGAEIAVDHQHSEDVRAAVRDAFDAARRRLEDHARVERGDVKLHRA